MIVLNDWATSIKPHAFCSRCKNIS